MNNDFLAPRRGQLHGIRRSRPAAEGWRRPTVFNTPEATAGGGQSAPTPSHPHQPQGNSPVQGGVPGGWSQHPAPKKSGGFKRWLQTRTKKQWAIVAIVAALLLGGGYAVYHFFIKKDAKPVVTQSKTEPAPTPAAPPQPILSTLTGMPVPDASYNERPVTAVMIENSPDARPQAGLNQAGVVFEAVAEGGITRFLTLFQDSTPGYLGPVRSVRPYYVSWLMGFDAAVAHVGGSADALAMIRTQGVKDLDQFANPGPYHRVSNRVAPHNMYTDVAKLRARQIEKGYTKSNFTGFARKPDAKAATPSVTSIDFNISGALYNAHYDYDATTNTYKRSEGGKPHMDEKAGQLAPKVVIGLVMPQSQNGIYSVYGTIGSGEAYVFQDGIMVKGTWSKPSHNAQIAFTAPNGAPLQLNPGQTWLTALGSASRITFK